MKKNFLLSFGMILLLVSSAFSQNIVITEINYNDPSSGTTAGDSLEYIEIQNFSANPVDLGGLKFTMGVTFIFPSTLVPPMGYVVIAKAATKVQNFYNITGVLQWDAGQSLTNNGGEAIVLKNPANLTIDSVWYNTVAPWPTTANGQGPSLMLCDPSLDNKNGANWMAAMSINANQYGNVAGIPVYGTPGTGCNSLPPYYPSFVTIPFLATFENTWKNGEYLRDIPDTMWKSSPASGNTSWRRNDDGTSASWTNSTTGAYTPVGAASTAHSARFHTAGSPTGLQGSLTLYVNLNTPGTKKLKFWYINTSGTDSLAVWLSQDSGITFTHLEQFLTATSWQQKQIILGTTMAEHCMLRFTAIADPGSTDIGIDQVAIDIAMPDDAGVLNITSPGNVVTNQTDTIKVIVKNFGANDLNSVNINWSVAGVVQTPVAYSTTIPIGSNSTIIALGAYTFPATGIVTIKAWTSLPNGNADSDSLNDTVIISTYYQPYATIPFYEGFDSTWMNKGATHDAPNNYWIASPVTGNNSWRRADDGATAGWTNITTGAFTPTGANGTIQSARFHTVGATSGTSGTLSLNINLNTPGEKEIRFYHINTSGNDSLAIFISTDGGTTFTFLKKFINASVWTSKVVFLGSIFSPTTVIKFKTSAPGFSNNSDVGIDELTIDFVKPDVGISKILSPVSGCALTGNDTVTVRVKNFGNMIVSNIPIQSPAGSFIIPDTLLPGDSIDFQVGTIAIPPASSSPLMVYTDYSDDANRVNDTVKTVITHFLSINTFPYTDDFENGTNYYTHYNAGSQASVSLKNGVGNQGTIGLLMTGHAAGTWPNNSQTTTTQQQAFGYADHKGEVVTSCVVDATSLTMPELRIDLRQTYSLGPNWCYFRVVVNDTVIIPDQAGKTFLMPTTQNADPFINHHYDLGFFGGQVFKLSLISACRLDQANSSSGFGDNVIIDNYLIHKKVLFDPGLVAIISPVSSCGLVNEPLTIKVINFGSQSISNIPMVYSLNGGPTVTENYTNPLNPGDTAIYTFTQPLNLSAPGAYDLKIYVDYPGDLEHDNDTINYQVVHSPIIGIYPHVQDFEGSFTGWTSGAISGANAWELGTPAKTILNAAHSGANAWVTGLTQNYDNNANCYVQSPCFNLSGITEPILSVWLNFSSQLNIDGMILEASIGYGNWTLVTGDAGFYNNNSNQLPLPGAKWSGNSNGWTLYKTSILTYANLPNVRFRFRFASNASINNEGFAIDDFTIREAAVDLVTTWVAPENTCGLGQTEFISVTVKNAGEKTAPYASFYYSFDGTTIYVDSVGGDILPGQVISHTTTNSGDLSVAGNYNMSIDVHTLGDLDLTNNLVNREVTHLSPINNLAYTNDFESSETHLEFSKNTNSNTIKVAGQGYQNSTAIMLTGGAAGTWPTGTSNTTTAAQAFSYTDHISSIKTCQLNLSPWPLPFLYFKLRQTYSTGPGYSYFRVLVNDTIPIGSYAGDTNFQATTASGDAFVEQWFDLSYFNLDNNLHNIVLQSACMYDESHSSTGIADASFIDDFVIDFAFGIQSQHPLLVSVSPNPTRDLIRVDLFNAPDGDMVLTDMMGRLVISRKLSGQRTEVLDLRDLPSGIYALNIRTNNGAQSVKVVKE